MRAFKSVLIGALALLVASCDLLPRQGGPTVTGPSSPTENGAAAPAAPVASAGGPVETREGIVTTAFRHLPPYPSAPQDPWLGVAGDGPRRRSAEDSQASVRGNDFACTSLHDHCFTSDTWLIENAESVKRSKYRSAHAYLFGPDGPSLPLNANGHGLPSDDYTAYRTVPATRTNLKAGALVMALTFPETQLGRGTEVFQVTWNTGVVDRVDWDLGFVFFVGQDRNYWITATRVAVLAWRPGGKVEILGGADRKALAVSASDVVLPPPEH